MQSQTHATGDDAAARLAELGLFEAALIEAVEAGVFALAACTDNDPQLYRGFSVFAAIVRRLREQLTTYGWTKEEDHGLSLTVSPDRKVAILVAGGIAETGRVTGSPTTRGARGPMTIGVVRDNRQLYLEGFDPDIPDRFAARFPNRSVWMLLYCIDPEARQARAELSFPVDLGERNRPTFSDRILLSPIALDDQPAIAPQDDVATPPIDFDIEENG